MTQHTVEFMNITRFVENRRIPEQPFERKRNEIWHVRATPLDFANENHSQQDWTLIRSGDLMRIPLCPYSSVGINLEEPFDLSKLFVVAFDLGQRFGQRYCDAVRTHIVMGMPIEDLRPTTHALRYWLGFAARIR